MPLYHVHVTMEQHYVLVLGADSIAEAAAKALTELGNLEPEAMEVVIQTTEDGAGSRGLGDGG